MCLQSRAGKFLTCLSKCIHFIRKSVCNDLKTSWRCYFRVMTWRHQSSICFNASACLIVSSCTTDVKHVFSLLSLVLLMVLPASFENHFCMHDDFILAWFHWLRLPSHNWSLLRIIWKWVPGANNIKKKIPNCNGLVKNTAGPVKLWASSEHRELWSSEDSLEINSCFNSCPSPLKDLGTFSLGTFSICP